MYSPLVLAVLLPLLSTALPATDSKPSMSWNSDGRQVVSFAGDSAVNFDNLDAETRLDLPIRSPKSVGAYSRLSYDHLGVVNNNTSKRAGLKPLSKPNVLGFEKVLLTQGKQTITSKYNDSITDSFDLKSFYFGCVLTSATSLGIVPVKCSMTVTAFFDGEPAAQQTVEFTPSRLLSTMGYASLSRFEHVDRVQFDLGGTLEKKAFAVLFDNFEYDVVLKQGARYEG
ncbi:hypothetical protein KC345_g1183 [Hortaea werneckii]|nr:hypothetical protein KC345_g1183 [Hortaea werneckii]